jgi:hypothetical protein
MDTLTKGYQTTEFYLILIIIAPWLLHTFGIDISAIISNPDDITSVLNAVKTSDTNTQVTVLVYVAIRGLLKWQVLRNSKGVKNE